MTIPILPNFFSSLRDSGIIGIDAFKQAQDRARQDALIQRSQDMQNIQLFTQLLPHLNPTPDVMGVQGGDNAGVPMMNPNPGYAIPQGVQQSFQRVTGGTPKLTASPEEQIARATAKATPQKLATDATLGQQQIAGNEQKLAGGALDLAQHQRVGKLLAGVSDEQLAQMNGIPGEVDLATHDDAKLKETAKRLVWGFKGDVSKAASLAQELYPNLVKSGAINEGFLREAKTEYDLLQQELAVKLRQAERSGRQPAEFLDDLVRGLNTQRATLTTQLDAEMKSPNFLIKDPATLGRVNGINAKIQNVDDQLGVAQGAFGAKVGLPTSRTAPGAYPTNPGTVVPKGTGASVNTTKIQQMIEAIKSGQAKESDIAGARTQGAISPDEEIAIRNGLRSKPGDAPNMSASRASSMSAEINSKGKKNQMDAVTKRLFKPIKP